MYRLRWRKAAIRQLNELWLQSLNRAAVTYASHQIEKLLERDPWSLGESRSGVRRVLVEWPLLVAYEIIEDDKKVVILGVESTEA